MSEVRQTKEPITITKEELKKAKWVLDYDYFCVIKYNDKYYVNDIDIDEEYQWREVELIKSLDEEEIKEKQLSDDDLLFYEDNCDYNGEYLYGTNFMYFRVV